MHVNHRVASSMLADERTNRSGNMSLINIDLKKLCTAPTSCHQIKRTLPEKCFAAATIVASGSPQAFIFEAFKLSPSAEAQKHDFIHLEKEPHPTPITATFSRSARLGKLELELILNCFVKQTHQLLTLGIHSDFVGNLYSYNLLTKFD